MSLSWLVFIGVLLVLAMVVLVYWVKTLLVMAKQSEALAYLLMGALVAPVGQIAYAIKRGAQMTVVDKRVFRRYFVSLGAWMVLLLVLLLVAIPAMQSIAVDEVLSHMQEEAR